MAITETTDKWNMKQNFVSFSGWLTSGFKSIGSLGMEQQKEPRTPNDFSFTIATSELGGIGYRHQFLQVFCQVEQSFITPRPWISRYHDLLERRGFLQIRPAASATNVLDNIYGCPGCILGVAARSPKSFQFTSTRLCCVLCTGHTGF